jgi:F-type H+-transporting ATPase subunit gamma
MQRIDIIERKLKTAKDLQSIVKTMKGLAAVSINQYEHAVDSITEYFSTIERGMQIILHKQPKLTSFFRSQQLLDRPKRIAIVFGSGQPMCGAFNEVLATFFDEHWDSHHHEKTDKIVIVGHRVRANLERYGWAMDHQFEMPTTIERINETVQSLVLAIQRWNAEDDYSEAYLFYNRPETNVRYTSIRQQLIPIDGRWLHQLAQQKWNGRSLPTYTMGETALISALTKQLLFVSIYRAFSASLSAENNSRLAAMQAAEKKITEMIDNLTKSYWSQRQINITEEILDIMSSFETLQHDESQQP